MNTRWHNGHNPLGFTPEADASCSETWADGAELLRSDMREYADADDDQAYADRFPEHMTAEEDAAWWDSDEVPAMRAHVDAVLKDDPPVPTHNTSYLIEDRQLRLLNFWLMKVTCICPVDD
jgi:hypothetical protein